MEEGYPLVERSVGYAGVLEDWQGKSDFVMTGCSGAAHMISRRLLVTMLLNDTRVHLQQT